MWLGWGLLAARSGRMDTCWVWSGVYTFAQAHTICARHNLCLLLHVKDTSVKLIEVETCHSDR